MKYIIIFICLCFAVIIFSLCVAAGNADEKIDIMIRQNRIKNIKEINMKDEKSCKDENRKYS